MSVKKVLVLAGCLLIAAAVMVACEPKPTPTPTEVVPTEEPMAIPFLEEFNNSPHADAIAEAFVHWDNADPAEVPVACAQCHTSAGYLDYLGADGSAAGTVEAAVKAPAGTLKCETCHNAAATALTSVTFPSGKTVSGLGPEARCLVCHQGRESKVSVDKALEGKEADTPSADIRFRNIHYFVAGVTLYGMQAEGGYQYDGKMYDAKNDHVLGIDTCVACHNQHTLEVKVELCAECHGVSDVEQLKNVREPSSAMDYDGDGNVEEGMYYEIEGLQNTLFAAIKEYATTVSGAGILYNPNAYPYWFLDANNDGAADTNAEGAPVAYNAWTPRLVKAAYNYQLSVKDPGAFAHGNKYIVQLLYDSIEDLNAKLGTIDMSAMHRDDAGHFAGNTMAFRDWDETGVVPYACVKCHTATGLPTFIKNGGTTVVSPTGTTLTTSVGSMPPSNGFQCTTCHDAANWPGRYTVASVVMPSGKTVSFGGKDDKGAWVADDANLCLSCHMGRESTTSMNNYLRGKEEDVANKSINFKNIHYFGAGATIFGNDAQGAYQYAERTYQGMTPHPVNKCNACHEVHALEPKLDTCAVCHGGVTDPEAIRMPTNTVDYDGDGNVTEGMYGEIETLSAALYAQLRIYAETKAGVPIAYNPHAYPYFFADANNDGVGDVNEQGAGVRYASWTPRLLKAAFNYQYVQKDPGGFVHNPKYVIQILIDSIADLGGDVTAYTRP